jgi:hypothetical protein
MDITDEQKAAITEWARQGEDLSAIQSRLKEELDITLTYVDTRFLLADLDLELIDEAEAEEQTAAPETGDAPGESAADEPDEPDEPDSQDAGSITESAPLDDHPSGATGEVSVTADALTQPGAMISGKVTFSDGECATWLVDRMGQLRLDAETENYRPSAEDIEKFQLELQKVASKQDL